MAVDYGDCVAGGDVDADSWTADLVAGYVPGVESSAPSSSESTG